jgi:hypothetical protein
MLVLGWWPKARVGTFDKAQLEGEFPTVSMFGLTPLRLYQKTQEPLETGGD